MGGIDILVEGSPESLRETATKLNQSNCQNLWVEVV